MSKNYMGSWTASMELVEKIKDYYRHTPQFKDIEVYIVPNNITGDYYVRSNISSFWPNIADLEDRFNNK